MGGRLPDNAWRVDWFLAIPRNANKDAGLERPARRCRALPPTPCREPSQGRRGFEATPGSAEKSLFRQNVSGARRPPRRRFAQIAVRPMNLTAG